MPVEPAALDRRAGGRRLTEEATAGRLVSESDGGRLGVSMSVNAQQIDRLSRRRVSPTSGRKSTAGSGCRATTPRDLLVLLRPDRRRRAGDHVRRRMVGGRRLLISNRHINQLPMSAATAVCSAPSAMTTGEPTPSRCLSTRSRKARDPHRGHHRDPQRRRRAPDLRSTTTSR